MEFERHASTLLEVGRGVADELVAEFERLTAIDSPDRFDPRLGFANLLGLLGPDGARAREAPVKYAIRAAVYIERWRHYLPCMGGLASAYEIGVGPGYLFRLMELVHGTRMRGCDVDPARTLVYDMIRTRLGVRERVDHHEVIAGVSTPIPPGTEAVLAFWVAFDNILTPDGEMAGWTAEQHEAFLCDLAGQLSGPRLLFIRLNRQHRKPADRRPRQLYQRLGTTPLPDDRLFFRIDLHQLLPTGPAATFALRAPRAPAG